jgi:hypothetical protein
MGNDAGGGCTIGDASRDASSGSALMNLLIAVGAIAKKRRQFRKCSAEHA